MEAKDGSCGFDFAGVYNIVIINGYIEYTINDGRKVKIFFSPDNNKTKIFKSFETEAKKSVQMQRIAWQVILDNFKNYVEQSQNN